MEQARASTGITGLDDILGGGLPTNRLYLVRGSPGVGKTTLGLHFLRAGVAQHERALYITLSESAEELRAVVHSHGWTLDGIDLFELSAMEQSLAADAANTVFHASDVELNETTQALIDLIERVKPSRVVFDSLSEMKLLARDALRYRRQILSLKQYLVGRGCTVLLLDDGCRADSDVQLESICHGVIALEQVASSYGIDRRRLRVEKLRGASFRSGYHDLVMQKGGLVVFPRLIASEHRRDIPQQTLNTGIPVLDIMLEGGLDRGTSTLFLGPAGAGKSSVAVAAVVAAARRGEHAVFYSFEESPRTLYHRSRELGLDIEAWVERGLVKLHHVDPAELTPGEFVQQVREEVSGGEVTVLVIDSLNGYLNAMPEERFLVLQLHELLSFLGQSGVACILVVAQHGIMNMSQASFDVSYLADTVVIFRLFEYEAQLLQAISIGKRRAGKHDRSIRQILFQNGRGIDLGEPLSNLRGIFTGSPTPVTGGEPSMGVF